jgi:hypothetical protein
MADTAKVISPNANGVSTQDLTLSLDDKTRKMLTDLVMYQNKDMVALFGIVAVQKEINKLASEFIASSVESRFKALQTQINDRRFKRNSELFRELVARGVPTKDAYTQAYGEEPKS